MAPSPAIDRNLRDREALALPYPYLLFLGDTVEPGFAKTAFGLRDWSSERCIGEWSLAGAKVTTGLEWMTPDVAAVKGARALVLGVANSGGVIPDHWLSALISALEAGLDIVAGMHARLAAIPSLAATADRLGRKLIDIRTPPEDIPIATGHRRSGRRLLTVGTDCALGKKYTAIQVARGLKKRGLDVTFRATGQTGILISGAGIPIDSVVSDFVSGAAELLSPPAAANHLDVIEGQGSLFHPSYAAVSLGLLHGSQPDLFIVCHDPTRATLLGNPRFALPTIGELIALTVLAGRLTSPGIRCAGISLNTASLDDEAAHAVIASTQAEYGLPVADPIRGGPAFEGLLDACHP